MLAYDFGLDERDVFALLEALGRDCAGALILLPEGEQPVVGGQPEPASDDEIARRLRELRFHPLGVDQRVRVSLAGMEEKLLLARSDGGWGLPVDGAPSTHILKPAHPLLPLSIANEALCLRTASHLGMRVADVGIVEFSDVTALVVERYDRVHTPDGVVRFAPGRLLPGARSRLPAQVRGAWRAFAPLAPLSAQRREAAVRPTPTPTSTAPRPAVSSARRCAR